MIRCGFKIFSHAKGQGGASQTAQEYYIYFRGLDRLAHLKGPRNLFLSGGSGMTGDFGIASIL